MKTRLIGGLRHGTVVEVPDDLPPYFEMPFVEPLMSFAGLWFDRMMIEQYRCWSFRAQAIDGTWVTLHAYAESSMTERHVRAILRKRNEGGF